MLSIGAPLKVVSSPDITTHPQGINAITGATANFSVAAGGGGLSYQWQKNGVDINGSTGLALSLANVQLEDNGTYRVLVSNAAGTVTSSVAELNVRLPDILAEFNHGLAAYYPFNSNANDESGNDNNGTVLGATLTADRDGAADKAYSFDGINDKISALFGNAPIGYSPRTLSIWLKPSSLDSTVKHSINWGNTDIGQAFGITKLAAGHDVAFYGYEADLDSNASLDTQWHQVTVTFGANGNREQQQGGPDGNVVKVYVDGTLKATSPVNLNTTGTSLLIGTALNNSNYWKGKLDEIRIYSRSLGATEVGRLWSLEKPRPTVADLPSAQAASAGSDITMSVTATSDSVISYQWYKDGNAISGATSLSFTIVNAQAANNGRYNVVVSNIQVSVTSNGMDLTINSTAPTITTQPATQSV